MITATKTNWAEKITETPSTLSEFLAYYEKEYEQVKSYTEVKGSVVLLLQYLPGQTEHVFGSLQEIESVLEVLLIKLKQLKRDKFITYLEGYKRMLSSRDAEKYAEGEQDVIDFELLTNSVALIRNKYLSIMKALDQKSFTLSNLTKLKTAGMEDFYL